MIKQLKTCALIFVFLLNAAGAVVSREEGKFVKIGVLAKRGHERCLEQWSPSADYLTSQIPGETFVIVPLDFDRIHSSVENGEIDFILADSSFYVELESYYGANRIATLKNLRMGEACTEFGGVIFYRADREDIDCLKDLKGKTFMAADEFSFGGWIMAWRELKYFGIDPYRDFAVLKFGGTHDAVVYAVRDGEVDAGTVRTDTLERMAAEGKINIEDFNVIHEHGDEKVHLPFLHSTRPYPEWPFAKVRHTEDELAEKVATALIEMSPDSPAARAAICAGWTIPLNYQPVHECMKELRLGPYKDYGKITTADVFVKYGKWILFFSFLFFVMVVTVVFILKLNQNIHASHTKLQYEVEERKLAEEDLKKAHLQIKQLFSSITSILIGLDSNNCIAYWNNASERIFGMKEDEVIGKPLDKCGIQWDWSKIAQCIWDGKKSNGSILLNDFRYTRPDGYEGFLNITANPVYEMDSTHSGFLLLGEEITEQKTMESKLAHAQKMESIGQLAAGIAHEINTPAQYVGDNTRFLKDSFNDILNVFNLYNRLINEANNGSIPPELVTEIGNAFEEADEEYLSEEIPRAIDQSLEGIKRISEIVQAMKEFSHPDAKEKAAIDINRAIKSTITVSRNEWKYVAEIKTDFDSDLPLVPCLAGEFNQVILNIIINAAHAIKDVVNDGSNGKGTITISTRHVDSRAEIRISDSGTGIPEENRNRVFDPFFTTKDVGKGTGQGLAISHNVIVDKHGGTISFDTEMGKGTTFIIGLPVKEN